jgi:UDP-N-acetylmuramate dehydrogenase
LKTLNLASFSSIRIGPIAKISLIEEQQKLPPNGFILGGCNNLLFSDDLPPLFMLSKNFDFIHLGKNTLHIGGATKSGKILSYAKKHNIAHFELMQKLPGTLGGMIKMNAGLKEWEVFKYLLAIKTSQGWIPKEAIKYDYRYTNIKDIIYEAKFELEYGFDNELLGMFKRFRDNQPKLPSAGSCFKNPPNNFAGKLLDEAGLKGKRIGGMEFSSSHANFLVNLGGGTFQEAVELITLAKKEVLEKFQIELQLELQIVKK